MQSDQAANELTEDGVLNFLVNTLGCCGMQRCK